LARLDTAPDVQALARELGIERALLYRWQHKYISGGAAALRNSGRPRPMLVQPPDPGLAAEEQAAPAAAAPPDLAPPPSLAAHDPAAAARRIVDLERKIGQQHLELDFFAQPCGMSGNHAGRAACLAGQHLRDDPRADAAARRRARNRAKLRFGQGQPGRVLPALAGVAAARQEEAALRDEIQRLSLANKHHGYRPVTVLLRRTGWVVNHKRVQRIRREDNLLCVSGRTFRPATTDSRHGWKVWPNLARYLITTTFNQPWVADITYVRLDEEFVYLAVVLDAFGRKVVGWAMAEHRRAELALAAPEMALAQRDVTPGGLIHHSDRGVQYACGDYIQRLERAGIQPSMSRAGCPWDNAMAESWMRTLKREEVDGRAYRDLAEAKASIGPFIEDVYNRQRLHSALAYLAPEAYEASQAPVAATVCG
jgi:transposase InsO family protein